MKKKNESGSALLIVVLVITILLTSMTMLWRNVAFSYEGAMWHYRAKRQFYANESLVFYGIALIKRGLVTAKQLPTEKLTLIYKGHWPKNAQTWGELEGSYDINNKQFKLRAKMFGNDHLGALLTTHVVCKKNDKTIKILSWENV